MIVENGISNAERIQKSMTNHSVKPKKTLQIYVTATIEQLSTSEMTEAF